MYNGLEVDPKELKNAANEIDGYISDINDNLIKATNIVNETSSSFDSEAAKTFRNKYLDLESKFKNFKEEMEMYSSFLKGTAEKYENIDKKIESAANSKLESFNSIS